MDQEMLDRVVAVTTADGTLAHRMGIKILSASGTEVTATMPVAGNAQPFGLLQAAPPACSRRPSVRWARP